MDEPAALQLFSALSHQTRLQVLRCLVTAGSEGRTAGQIAVAVGATPSRASFHLSAMSEAGLVTATKSAREVIYSVRFETLGALITYLLEDCCAGSPELRACCPPLR